MVRVKDTKTFIEKARIKHGDKYIYDKTVYNGAAKKLTVTCPEHDDFEIRANNHVNVGSGCPKCAAISTAEKLSKNNLEGRRESFIEQAKEVWGNKYDYSEVVYQNQSKKVKIICPDHKEFYTTPNAHLTSGSSGCSGCVVEKRKNNFIRSANKMHGDRYDYSNIDFVNQNTKITIYCKNHNVHFQTTPNQHLTKYCGCSRCVKEDRIRDKQEELIKMASQAHGDKYDYSLVQYKSFSEKVVIRCPVHGEFLQDLASHSRGQQCPGCSNRGGYRGNPNSAYGIAGLYGTENPANLYLIKVGEDFIKVGVSKEVNTRFNDIRRETKSEITILGVWHGKARDLFKVEQEILHKSNFEKYEPESKFVGSTECFQLNEQENMKEYIENKIIKEN